MDTQQSAPDAEGFKTLKHDINNQLSNINLALEQLRYELPPDAPEDCAFYLDMVKASCAKIVALLKDAG